MPIFVKASCLFSLVLAVLCAPYIAAADTTDGTPPGPEGVPTPVSIGLYVIDISGIDNVTQTFTADFHLMLKWKDTRLAGREGAGADGRKVPLEGVWNPVVQVLNQRSLKKQYDDTVVVDGEGNVTYRQRYYGTLAFPVLLEDFPLDSHMLSISIASFRYGPKVVSFAVDPSSTGRMERFSIVDWSIGPGETSVASLYLAAQDQHFTRLDYEFQASRYAWYYILRVITPIILIVFMSWSVFWIDPERFEAQLALSATSILTLVMFQFSVGDLLPRISYLTRMDAFILGTSVLIFLALIESVTTSRLAGSGRRKLALNFDHWSKIFFPVAFTALVVFAFWI